MREFLEFRYLKSFEYVFRQLEKDFFEKVFSREKWERFCLPYSFTDEQKNLLAVRLKERGFEFS